MREIKFRAWDNEKKNMVDVRAVDWSDEGIVSINYPQGKLYSAPEDFGGEVKLMQYTGFKDKNGKEIYEGDVVQLQAKNDSLMGEFTVTWSQINAMFRGVNHDGDGSIGLTGTGWKVIGNIYENPELVK